MTRNHPSPCSPAIQRRAILEASPPISRANSAIDFTTAPATNHQNLRHFRFLPILEGLMRLSAVQLAGTSRECMCPGVLRLIAMCSSTP
jgi:hypothetical protein